MGIVLLLIISFLFIFGGSNIILSIFFEKDDECDFAYKKHDQSYTDHAEEDLIINDYEDLE
jgi:hypothetical protein